jgi:glycerophosphoryl diester phosphodiesterase
MNLPAGLENTLLRVIDGFYRRRRQPTPAVERLQRCKLIAHRGEHDNRRVFENTLPAFDRAAAAGAWGIEFDVRWTRDMVPLVIHDADTVRLFGGGHTIRRTTAGRLKRDCPLIPTLAEVIGHYGTRLHLMVEIKPEPHADLDGQSGVLEKLFAALRPGRDFHLISMAPQVFQRLTFVPSTACLPIARSDVRRVSRRVAANNYGGLLGHYSLVTRRRVRRLQNAGRKVGTGFVNSENCLLREVNRGVDYIFSDTTAALLAFLKPFQRKDGWI